MAGRFVVIWFPHLTTDRFISRQPELKDMSFVLAAPERGRMVIRAASIPAEASGITSGMVVADAKALLPSLVVIDDRSELAGKLLAYLAEWCLRYTPVVAVALPDSLILDIRGCAHLWGGEQVYLKDILSKLNNMGYDARAAIADTIGAAWAVCRYGKVSPFVDAGAQLEALLPLPPAALRLEPATLQRMQKLGLYRISSFIQMPRNVLRRRFGPLLLERLDQALGQLKEPIEPIRPVEPYQERLPSQEPIRTATGIKIALQRLLETLCKRLVMEGKGLRKAVFKGYRIDGKLQQIEIGTNAASCNVDHLFRLFELKVTTIAPALGIELFILEAPVVEDLSKVQQTMWQSGREQADKKIAELLDRMTARGGMDIIHRYLPAEHYWPERSVKVAVSLDEKPATAWRTELPRPVHLLPVPELIEVAAPIPDYPPMLFIYKGTVHKITRADGPERIEQEWWIENSLHRDYYQVEDDKGARYWLFRLGHYDEGDPQWFIHGFFA
ncbi:Y-family DNA polymerase [Taibaiella koreensis]|uniref:Y-family DNA polymerase n=1 Tax=Taibaiella koreensis TaxID=1268548 RepID=UPI000E599BA2|nr:DNA polymerase Y family protein [Taibaiella koreensis]